jgi:alpha-tubulin suppressor-like RCC1 family protein
MIDPVYFNGSNVIMIGCGLSHTIFYTSDHNLYACGSAKYSKLFVTSEAPCVFIPTKVTDKNWIFLANRVTCSSISAGMDHSVVLFEYKSVEEFKQMLFRDAMSTKQTDITIAFQI